MGKRSAAVIACLVFAFAPSAIAQTFVAPKPEAAAPRKATGGSARATQRSRPAPQQPAVNLCEQMTAGWVDYRPMYADTPAADGRVSFDQQQAAVSECGAEQQRRPGDIRTAFTFARALEVNGHGGRAAGLYRQLSDAGYTPAMTQLARTLFFGNGVARDSYAACALYVDAANAGDTWAYNGAANCMSFWDYAHDATLACRYYDQALASGTFQTVNLARGDYCQ
jgi:TPR repeat protein